MKRLILAFATVLFAASLFAQTYPSGNVIDNSAYLQSGVLQNVPLTGDKLYINDGSNFMETDLNNPSSTSNIVAGYGVEGDFDDSGMLYYTSSAVSHSPLYRIDLSTGTNTLIANLNGADIASSTFIISMSYYNGSMYATFDSDGTQNTSIICRIDLTTGLCTRINTNLITGFFTVLAIDPVGNFYGIDGHTNDLYLINPINGTRSLIGNVGLTTYTYCDADFNSADGNLYFVTSDTRILDVTDGSSTVISPIGGNLCAAGALSSVVPVNYAWIALLFLLIPAGILFRRRFF